MVVEAPGREVFGSRVEDSWAPDRRCSALGWEYSSMGDTGSGWYGTVG